MIETRLEASIRYAINTALSTLYGAPHVAPAYSTLLCHKRMPSHHINLLGGCTTKSGLTKSLQADLPAALAALHFELMVCIATHRYGHGSNAVYCRFAYKLDGVESEIGPGDPPACIPAGTVPMFPSDCRCCVTEKAMWSYDSQLLLGYKAALQCQVQIRNGSRLVPVPRPKASTSALVAMRQIHVATNRAARHP